MAHIRTRAKAEAKKLDKFGAYVVIPLGDRQKVRSIGAGLQDYWLDCWQADPFGTRWVLLPDDPDNTTQAKYRKQLTQLGLFLFEKRGTRGHWSIWCLNLRGSRIHLSGKLIKQYFEQYGVPPLPRETLGFLNTLLDENEQTSSDVEKASNGVDKKVDDAEKSFDDIEEETAETPSQKEEDSVSISFNQFLNTSSKEGLRRKEVLRKEEETPRLGEACVSSKKVDAQKRLDGFTESGEFKGNSPANVEDLKAISEAIEGEMTTPEYQKTKLEASKQIWQILNQKRLSIQAACRESQLKLSSLWNSPELCGDGAA